MSSRTFANDALNDALNDASQSSFPHNDKINELQARRENEDKSIPGLDDDADDLDDSSSSYCTALCSLDSEDSEDEMVFTEAPREDASSESSHSEAASETSKISSVTYVPSYECETKAALRPIEETKITVLNLNLTNINSVVAVPDTTPSISQDKLTLMPWDYFRSKNRLTDLKPVQSDRITQPRSAWKTNTLQNEKKCIGEMHRALQGGIRPKQEPTTHQQSFIESHYKVDSGKSILGILKREEVQEQGTGAAKEQAKLSVKAENRNVSANCTSTLTPKLQKSGILPRSHSERILATNNQHASPSLAVPWCRQGVWQSALLPPTPSGGSRKHSNTAENLKGTSSMAAPSADTTTNVRALASSCSEANYMDVLDYTSSVSSCDGDLRSCCTDAGSFQDHKTLACSETSSTECIDVALENHERITRTAKTVPKRQIQLRKREDTQVSDINVFLEVPSPPSRPRDILQRQHSTPAAFRQDSYSDQTDQKQKLQKSLSLDETTGKTKKASCIIKSVLLKRMQHEQNLGTLDVTEQDFGPLKASNNDCLSSSAKEVKTESDPENPSPTPYLTPANLLQNPTLQTFESQPTRSTIKEHISVSSKTQPKLITKHSFNPLICASGRLQKQGSDETTTPHDTKNETLGHNKDSQVTSQSTEEKSKVWNPSAVMSKPASVKTTREDSCPALGVHKLQNVKNQVISSTEKQQKEPEENEDTHCHATPTCKPQDVDESILEKVNPQSPLYNQVKDQGHHSEEPIIPGQSGHLHIQSLSKCKATAPVHVVRDIRSLVKNIYSRSSSEAAQGLKAKNEKPLVQKKTALDRVRLFSSRGNLNSPLKSHDNLLQTRSVKINPVSMPTTNRCAVSRPQHQGHENQTVASQSDAQGSDMNMKQTSRKEIPTPAKHHIVNKLAKKEQHADSNKLRPEKLRNPAEHQGQPQANRLQHRTSIESSDQQESTKLLNETCLSANYVHQTPCLPAGSQNTAGSPSACVLTVAPTPLFSSYLYKPNTLGYQTLATNIGTANYVQGPVFMQTSAHHQPMSTNASAPFMQLLCSSEEAQNATPDIQQCRTFITALGTESTQAHPEMSPRHVLLDPETGHCFYVDMPQLPQRKMLFDPETCQYVEVVLPQQTFSTPVMTPSCAIPFPSLHIPTVYPPHCLSFVQTHPQMLKPPGP